MTPWMDAIDKLKALGYWVTLKEGRLRYAYCGKGNPPQDQITPLLEVLKVHRDEILNDPCFLVDQTLQEIDRGLKPGTLTWMKQTRPDEWRRMLKLEGKINGLVLRGDVEGLKNVLREYRELMLNTVKTGNLPSLNLPLLGGDENG